jgi:hypothetical protein
MTRLEAALTTLLRDLARHRIEARIWHWEVEIRAFRGGINRARKRLGEK